MKDSTMAKHGGDCGGPFPCRTGRIERGKVSEKTRGDEPKGGKISQLLFFAEGKLIGKEDPKVRCDQEPIDDGEFSRWVVVAVGKQKKHQVQDKFFPKVGQLR